VKICYFRFQITEIFFAGILSCAIILLISIFVLLIECQKRKLKREKDRFFQQNGGILLYEQIRSKQIDTVRIFTTEELKHATNNFDSSREVGKGSYGTVYKGVLKDNRIVAIKRSKIMNMVQKDDFVQEMIILSQINHRNIVRLLGCCLEVEVPMLIYEFIPNGTLFDLIHSVYRTSPISMDTRLRIAQESAEALAYLHSSASPPIVHGDVKSPNILLDDNYVAKVTDFGASRMLAKDEIQFMTMVQGTLGYLDPEYLQERRLTEKSDVYSFGVVLVELITRRTAIYSEGSEEKKSLASSFLVALKENRLQSILDRNILSVRIELLQEVAQLAKCCLSMNGEERPLMTEVSERLRYIRRTWREQLIEHANDEIEYLPDYPVNYQPSSSGQHRSLMALDLETGR
jgi:serine/threonine protein kinase